MNIKDMIFDVIESQYKNENVEKLIIKKDIINKSTSIQVSFSNELPNKTIIPEFKEKKTLDLMLLRKFQKAIKLIEPRDIDSLFILVILDSREFKVFYEIKKNIYEFNSNR